MVGKTVAGLIMEAIQQVYPLKGILFEIGLGSSAK